MKRSRGVSTFVATLVLVTISLSLSYLVYEGVGRLAPPRQVVFSNQVTPLAGSPLLIEVAIIASSPSTPIALQAGDVGSKSGVLFFDGARYGATNQLCLSNATTFFSVFTGNGTLQAISNGRSWIDGYWTSSLAVKSGWQEVMFSGASSCGVTNTDGSTVSYPGNDTSSVPLMGSSPSAQFTMYLPSGTSYQQLLLVFEEGYDQIA